MMYACPSRWTTWRAASWRTPASTKRRGLSYATSRTTVCWRPTRRRHCCRSWRTSPASSARTAKGRHQGRFRVGGAGLGGGLIAGRFTSAREWQESLLARSRNAADISRGVDAANGKLDALVADSRDPQRDVVARGYSFDYSGLSNAIRQADVRAIRLFARAGFKAQGQTPIVNLLNGPQPWSDDVAAALPADMFASPSACDDAGLLNYELRPPVDRRMAIYKLLCGSAESIERLREKVEASDIRHREVPGPQ